MSLTAFFYDETHDPSTLVEEIRFKSREQDPLGDYEHSPDGDNLLIWKDPSDWPIWARTAKRWSLKWRVEFREAFRVSSWLFQLATGDQKYFQELVNQFEEEVERTCPHCGADYVIPPQLWGGVSYCPSCGREAEEIAWKWVARKYRKLLAATIPLEPRDRSIGYKPEPDPWVPLPIYDSNESEEPKTKDQINFKIQWTNLREASKGMKALYKLCKATKEKKFSYEEASLLWEKAKLRKKKLLIYKELAQKKLIQLYEDAYSKTLRGKGTPERVEEWVNKLPVSSETKEFIKTRLNRNLEFWKKGLLRLSSSSEV